LQEFRPCSFVEGSVMGTEGGAVANEPRVPLPVDLAPFDAFYDAALPQVYGYVLRLCGGDEHEAWDLTQDAWTELVDQLRAGRSDLMSVGWLVTVARNRFLDRCRRDDRLARKLRLVAAGDRAMPEPEPISLRHVVEHINGCSPQHRAVLMMAYVDDLPVATIAATLGLSLSRTYALLERARAELRAQLTGDES